jgi:hypothetical protein
MRSLAYLLALALVLAVPAGAADTNSVSVIGNVFGVSRTTHVGAGQPIDTMAIYSAARVEIGAYLVVGIRCPLALDCFDSWWLSSRCRAIRTDTVFAGGSSSTIVCAPHSSFDGTDMGACVEMDGHLSPDPQTGDNVVYPDRVDAMPYWICDTKP